MRNYKVLVNLAEDSISSHFSSNECIHVCRKELFHTMPTSSLHEVTRATALAHLLYAAPAWCRIAPELTASSLEL